MPSASMGSPICSSRYRQLRGGIVECIWLFGRTREIRPRSQSAQGAIAQRNPCGKRSGGSLDAIRLGTAFRLTLNLTNDR
jgi:hypothetical protein